MPDNGLNMLEPLQSLPAPKVFVDRRGATWKYREKLNGTSKRPATLLLPGASGTSEFFFQQFVAWPEEHELVLVDYPGTISPHQLAEGMRDLVSHLALASINFVGCSYSSYWGQIYSAIPENRARRIILCNGFTDRHDFEGNPLFDERHIRSVSPKELQGEWLERVASSPNSLLRVLLTNSLQEWLPAEDLYGRLLSVAQSKAIEGSEVQAEKLLILDCDDDPIVGEAARQRLRQKYSSYHAKTISGGHYPYVMKPHVFSQEIWSFLGI